MGARGLPRSTGNTLTNAPSQDPARALLLGGLETLAIAATPEQIALLLRLAALLESWARRINLTGHRTRDAIVLRLLLDAAALSTHIPPLPSLADIGSGAGFPGLPLAILRPNCRFTLVEARRRRHHFQRTAVRELGLGNATLLLGRAEQLEARPQAAVIAQAMARPERALRWMIPWVEDGGLVLLPGAAAGPRVPAVPEVSFETCIRYRVPCGGPDRSLWVGRRRAT